MLPCQRNARVNLFLKGRPCGLSKFPPKYSDDDWDFNNQIKIKISKDQEHLADRIMEESRRLVEETNETTKNWQREVEHHLRERASEIRFLVEELNKQKKTALLELEALLTYRDRILSAMDFLKERAITICSKCMVIREGRLSVDLCEDEVDRALRRELKVIRGTQDLLNRALKEGNDQIRKLRAAMYLLDKDLMQKDKSLLIDEKNLRLRQNQRGLGSGQDLSQHHCQYSLGEWQHTTYKNLETNAKELVTATQLRAYIDLILKQVCEDLQNTTDATNDALTIRINEMKHVKHLLENKHTDTMNHIHDVQRNIQHLEKELADKQRALTLCQTRLSNRAKRPGLELTCDTVQDALYHEMGMLQNSICRLNTKIKENNASLRYLLHVQMMQEEEINIKTNSLKLDECEVVPLRQVLKYQTF